MSVYLSGTRIPGYNQKVSARLNLAGEDMSGQSSYTSQVETGDKPKEVTVYTEIKFTDKQDLTDLVNLAEARKSTNERMIYNILNHMANAMGIRQVVFQGTLDVHEDDRLNLFIVNFSLIEYASIPEKKEKKQADKNVSYQDSTGTPVAEVAANPALLAAAAEASIKRANELLK